MDRSRGHRRLPDAYATALRPRDEDRNAKIAARVNIDIEAVEPLLRSLSRNSAPSSPTMHGRLKHKKTMATLSERATSKCAYVPYRPGERPGPSFGEPSWKYDECLSPRR